MAAGVLVDHLGEGRAEALEVHAALLGVDVVGERHDPLRVAAVPLDGDLDLAALLERGVVRGLALDVDGAREAGQDGLLGVEVLDEVVDAAGVAELLHARGELALVGEDDLEVLVEERGLLQVVVQGVEVVDRGLEDGVVRPEGDGGAGGLRLADLGHLLGGLAARELHLDDLAVTLDLRDELLRERVDDGDADAVQAAGHLVGVVVELAACVQDGEDDLEGRLLLGLVDVDGDATTVIDDGDRVVGMHRDRDLGAVAGHGLVNRVVDDLPHEVVKTRGRGGTDVHARSHADGLEALEDLDVVSAVVAIVFSHSDFLSISKSKSPSHSTSCGHVRPRPERKMPRTSCPNLA